MASLLLRQVTEFFSKQLKQRAAANGRTVEQEHRAILEEKLTEPPPEERHREAVARRLNRLRYLLNESPRRPNMGVAEMATALGLNRVSDLESYMLGEEEAPLDLLHHIAQVFGANTDWLKFGKRRPFHWRLHRSSRGHGLVELIDKMKPERVFFVRDWKSEIGAATMILQLDDYRFEGLDSFWHISSHFGGTGAADLVALRDSLLEIERRKDLYRITDGCDLPESRFDALRDGEIWPGTVLLDQRYRSQWQDDFTDVFHKMPIAKEGDGYSHYGKGFMDAQDIVRSGVRYREEEAAKAEQRKA